MQWKTIIKLDLNIITNIEDAVVIKKVKSGINIVYVNGLIDPKDSEFYIMTGELDITVMDVKNNLLTEIGIQTAVVNGLKAFGYCQILYEEATGERFVLFSYTKYGSNPTIDTSFEIARL